VVAFQPHHFYRTALYLREFGEALGLADEVVVLEVFAPGETPVPGVSGTTLAAGVPLPSEQVVFEPSWTKVPKHLADRARSGDVVMTLGAGDIGLMCDDILVELGASQ
jgi:UDP-N-acetylmuramate--alanine ligase